MTQKQQKKHEKNDLQKQASKVCFKNHPPGVHLVGVVDNPMKTTSIGTEAQGFMGTSFPSLSRARKALKREQVIVRQEDNRIIAMKW